MFESERGTLANVRTTQRSQDCPRQSGTYGQPTHMVFISSNSLHFIFHLQMKSSRTIDLDALKTVGIFMQGPVTGSRSREASTLTRAPSSVCVSHLGPPAVSELGPFSLAHVFAWLTPTSPSGLAFV